MSQSVHVSSDAIDDAAEVKDIWLLGAAPFSGAWRGGDTINFTWHWALDEINARSDVLPGYRLRLKVVNTACSPGRAVYQITQLVYSI